MWEIILETIKWVFSGIGTKIFSEYRSKNIEKKESSDNKVPHEIEPQIKEDTIETESQKVAKRFKQILTLINDDRYEKLTIYQTAKLMGLKSAKELEDVIYSKSSASFELIDIFCKVFGVNDKWLTDGYREPFSNNDQTMTFPLWYLSEIKSLSPTGIYFIREDTASANAFILLRLSDWKFKILRRSWPISEHVGGTGQVQIYSFYQLIKKLKKDFDLNSKCWGLTLNTEDFRDLFNGKVFPDKFISGRLEDPWWDDLTDVYHKHSISNSYEKNYGTSFIKAQEIIKYHIEN